MRFSLAQLQQPLAATLHGHDVSFAKLSTDTRLIQAGDLFVALQGPNFDGHDYVMQALNKGAVAALVDRPITDNISYLQVDNTRLSLGQLANYRLQGMSGINIAVTGSCGKTTVKEMLYHLLSQAGKVQVTQGNFNNDIGVPLTVWAMAADKIDYRVFELGANHVGEIAYTSAIVEPNIAILTNAQAAHLSGFGGYEGVVKTKGEIITALQGKGHAVLNKDDSQYDYWVGLARNSQIWSFSVNNSQASVHTKQLILGEQASEFILVVGDQERLVQLPLAGQHNVQNALAAAAAARAAGISIDHIVAGLAQCQPYRGRLVWHRLSNDNWLIDDSYNANPASVQAAIDVLSQQPHERCLVLGDMGELGDESQALHQQVGEYAASRSIDYVITFGNESRATATAYLDKGGKHAKTTTSFAELTDVLHTLAHAANNKKINYLVKGSRSSRMERAVSYLLGQEV